MAADNIAMAAYLAGCMSIPAEDAAGQGQQEGQAGAGPPEPVTSTSMSLATAVAAAACCAGPAASHALFHDSAAGMAITAALSAIVCCMTPAAKRVYAGAEALAGALMLPFFATIGAAAGAMESLPQAPAVFLLIGCQLGVHVAVVLGAGRLFKLPMQVLLIASNANVGGPGTAAAMAGARNWPGMVVPAMLTGSLGYAIGTGIGIWMGGVLAPVGA